MYLSISKAAKYAGVRKATLLDAVQKGYLRTYPSLAYRLGYSDGNERRLDTEEIDALVKGRAAFAAQK